MSKSAEFALLACLLMILGGPLWPLDAAERFAEDDSPQPATIELLAPTGPLSLGRTSYHWVGQLPGQPRVAPGGKREIMAHFWYPAQPDPGGAVAVYIPGLSAIEAALGTDQLQALSGPAYPGLSTARTHVVADAILWSETKEYPVLLLAHGLRFSSLGYSMLAEELASHGYIVVGIEEPATAMVVPFPEQRFTRFDEALWTRQRTREETLAFEQAQAEQCAANVVFALNQLERLQSGALHSPFQGRLDLARVGALGHSFGGRVVARACQIDQRLKAGVILDGFGRTMYVERTADGSTIEQPMMIQYATRVPDNRLAQILGRLQNNGKDLEEELRPVRKEFCESVKGPSYEVVLKMPGISHESFSDIPLLEGDLNADTRRNRQQAMATIRNFTRAFFNRHLLALPAPWIEDAAATPHDVELIHHTFRGQ